MAKNMARISGGAVTNIEYWGETQSETTTLKNIGDKPVRVGDFYRNGKFYHGDEEIISPLEKENRDLLAALGAVTEALYEADLAVIGT